MTSQRGRLERGSRGRGVDAYSLEFSNCARTAMIVVARVVLFNYCSKESLKWSKWGRVEKQYGSFVAELLCGVADREFLGRPGRVDLYLQSSAGKEAVAQVDEIRNSKQVSTTTSAQFFFPVHTAWIRNDCNSLNHLF